MGSSETLDFSKLTHLAVSGTAEPGKVQPAFQTVITGSGFTGATEVGFGPVNTTDFTVVNDSTVTALVPAESGRHPQRGGDRSRRNERGGGWRPLHLPGDR
jgi:hypothetical protein